MAAAQQAADAYGDGPLQTVDVDATAAYRLYLAAHVEHPIVLLPTLGQTLRLPGVPVHAAEMRWAVVSVDQGVMDAMRRRAAYAYRYDALFEALQAVCRQHPEARVRIYLSAEYATALECVNVYYTGVPRKVTQAFLGTAHGLCFLSYAPDGSALIDAVPLCEKRRLRELRQQPPSGRVQSARGGSGRRQTQ